MASMNPPMRTGEVPLEHASVIQLASTLAYKVLTHPTTIKASILIAVLVALLYAKLNKQKSIRGKTIVLTGAGNGLGRAQALELAKQGCKVIIWDIDAKGLQETAEIVKGKYPNA